MYDIIYYTNNKRNVLGQCLTPHGVKRIIKLYWLNAPVDYTYDLIKDEISLEFQGSKK